MLTLVRSIVSVLAYRFRNGRRLVEAMLDNAALENLLGRNAEACALGLRWSLQLAGGRTDVRRIELIKPGSFDLSSGSATVRYGSSGYLARRD
jgi:hypothetical protein